MGPTVTERRAALTPRANETELGATSAVVSRMITIAALVVLVAAACAGDRPTLATGDAPAGIPTAAAATPTTQTAGTDEQVEAAATPSSEPDGPASEDEPGPAEPTTDDTPDAETDPTPTASGLPEPAEPTSTPAPAVPVGCQTALSGEPVRRSDARVDVDADGATDVLSVYATGSNSAPTGWRIRLETASGDTFDNALFVDAGDPLAPIQVIGAADADGDGAADELFTVVGAGASAEIVAVHVRQGCDLVPVTIGGSPVSFPVGGSIGSLGGVGCRDTDGDGLTDVLTAWSGLAQFDQGEGTYLIDAVDHVFVGAALEQVASSTFTASVTAPDFVYSTLACGGLAR